MARKVSRRTNRRSARKVSRRTNRKSARKVSRRMNRRSVRKVSRRTNRRSARKVSRRKNRSSPKRNMVGGRWRWPSRKPSSTVPRLVLDAATSKTDDLNFDERKGSVG